MIPGQKERIPLNASYIISKEINRGSRIVIVVNVIKHPFEIINYDSGKEAFIDDAGDNSYIEIPIWKTEQVGRLPSINSVYL